MTLRRNDMKKILTTLICMLLVTVMVYAQSSMDKLLSHSGIERNKVAVIVVDINTDSTLLAHNIEGPLVPASVMKAITIASTISSTGIDYRYMTRIYMVGSLVGEELQGDLLIIGGGDPSLNARSGPQSGDIVDECVNALIRKGVKRITGDIKVNQTIFPGPATVPSWAKEDLKYGYGAGCYGLNFENNSYLKGSQSYSMSNPATTLSRRIKEACAERGVTFEAKQNDAEGQRTLLLEHRSATIDEIMRHCMQVSDNLYAETLLRTLALSKGEEASTQNGIAIEKEMWRAHGLDFKGVTLIDGSGLSRSNRMTAKFLAGVLKHASDNADYASFFPLAGQEGTLAKFLKDTPLDSYIALKTGSMRGIQCYAGYMLDDDYVPTHVVVMMINDFTCDRSTVRSLCEEVLLEVFNNSNN